MATDKMILDITSEKVNSEFTSTYQPFFPYLTANDAKVTRHTEQIGKVVLKSTNIIGDAKARIINAQDTEIKHAKSGQTTKTFNKFVAGIKFIVSGFVDNSDFQNNANEILEANMMEYDKMVFTGNKKADGSLVNNAAWHSADPNYIENAPLTIDPTAANINQIKAIFDALIKQAEEKLGNAPKLFVLVGKIADVLGKLTERDTTFARTILNAFNDLGKQAEFFAVPNNLIEDLPAADKDGILLLTPAMLTFHITSIPHIAGQGFNAEDNYTWMNLIYGSAMIGVDKIGAAIKQPLTI